MGEGAAGIGGGAREARQQQHVRELDDGSGGSESSDMTEHGMALMRSHDENNSVGRRKGVPPDWSSTSCSVIEPTATARGWTYNLMNKSYIPLDPQPQLRRLDSTRASSVRCNECAHGNYDVLNSMQYHSLFQLKQNKKMCSKQKKKPR
jgi:hypothetical protein